MVDAVEQIRVLIFSPSPYMRYRISGELDQEPGLFVVGTARTCEELARKYTMLRPNLLVIDLESRSELLELRRLSMTTKLPSLALCEHTHDGAQLAFAALEAGIADIAARSNGDAGGVRFAPDLRRKVRGLANVRPAPPNICLATLEQRAKASPRPISREHSFVVVISSTGGLGPLTQLLASLPAQLPASLLILSSLPERFLEWFSSRIDPTTALTVRKAEDGMPLQVGVAYFVPCEWSVTIGPDKCLSLDRGAPPNRCYLSADDVLTSAAARYGRDVVGVFFSGIGQDGVQGALGTRAAGGTIIVQELATCVAAETPRAVIDAGGATVILPVEQVAGEIARRLSPI